jgi:hypothetical protein
LIVGVTDDGWARLTEHVHARGHPHTHDHAHDRAA